MQSENDIGNLLTQSKHDGFCVGSVALNLIEPAERGAPPPPQKMIFELRWVVFWVVWGAPFGVVGAVWACLAPLGGLLGASWRRLGGHLETSWGILGASSEHLALLWLSWRCLGHAILWIWAFRRGEPPTFEGASASTTSQKQGH